MAKEATMDRLQGAVDRYLLNHELLGQLFPAVEPVEQEEEEDRKSKRKEGDADAAECLQRPLKKFLASESWRKIQDGTTNEKAEARPERTAAEATSLASAYANLLQDISSLVASPRLAEDSDLYSFIEKLKNQTQLEPSENVVEELVGKFTAVEDPDVVARVTQQLSEDKFDLKVI